MQAIVSKFGLKPRLRAVRSSLLGVRRADRDVEGSVRGRRRRSVPRMRPGTSISAVQSQDWTALWLAQGAAGGVGGACVKGFNMAGSTRHWFKGPGAAQTQANQINVLFRLEHGPVVRVEAPHPGVIDLRVAEFQKPRVGAPGAIVLVHLEQPVMDARVQAATRAWIFKRLRARGCSSSPSPSSGGMTQACLRDGEDRSCMASSVPEKDVAPLELPFGQGFVKLADQEMRSVRREVGDEARKGVFSARVVLGHDRLAHFPQARQHRAHVVSIAEAEESVQSSSAKEKNKHTKRFVVAAVALGSA